MTLRSQPRSWPARSVAWGAVALIAVVVGVRYVVTEPLIFEPGGWFGLDGRRVLDAASTWRAGGNPYAVAGFVYSPVAVVAAVPLTFVPAPVAIVSWVAASGVVAASMVWRALRAISLGGRLLGVAAVLLFIPTIADLVLANVTIALCAAIWMAVRGGSARSALPLGVLALAFPKPFLVPVLFWFVLNHRRGAAGSLAGAIVAFALSVAAAGIGLWASYFEALRSFGTIDLEFVGNYGLSQISTELAAIGAIAGSAAFLWLLATREAEWSFLGALALGPFVSPYAGIYASLPLLMAMPNLARAVPVPAIAIAATAVVTAPSPVLVGGLALLAALVFAGGHRGTPPSEPSASVARTFG